MWWIPGSAIVKGRLVVGMTFFPKLGLCSSLSTRHDMLAGRSATSLWVMSWLALSLSEQDLYSAPAAASCRFSAPHRRLDRQDIFVYLSS